MRIALTLLRPDPVDLAVTVDAEATVGDVARALAPGPDGPGAASGPLTVRVHGPTGARVLPATAPAAAAVRPGAVVSLTAAQPATAADTPRVARLRVLAGPDTGLAVDLPEGRTILGRSPGCDVRLTDPTVSAEHACVTIGDVVEVSDLRSSNGVLVGGTLLQRAQLAPGDEVRLGGTALTVERLAASRHAADAGGPVVFNRSPRVAEVFPAEEVEAPTPPEPPRPVRLPWVMLAVPLVMAPLLLLAGRDGLSLLFLAMMPLFAIGTYLDQVITARRTHRAALARFRASVAALREELEDRRLREGRVRRAEHPAAAEAISAALALEPLLWTRRPEHDAFAELRLGTGAMPSRTTVRLPGRGTSTPEHWSELTALRDNLRDVADVPVTVHLREAGAVGIAGPRHVGVARGMVAQLVALHAPSELVVAAVTSSASAARWRWLTWLPHAGPARFPLTGAHLGAGPGAAAGVVAELEALLERRESEVTLPVVIVVVEDDAPVDRGRLVRLAERGPAAGVHVLWCAAAVERLPAACRAFVETAGDGAIGLVTTATTVRPVACEEVTEADAAALGRHLAGVTDAGEAPSTAAQTPEHVGFLALHGPDRLTADGVVQRWRETGSLTRHAASRGATRVPHVALRTLIGVGPDGPVAVDLRADGPHALVGGTTGAGKSELLQAWVLGLAAGYSPDRVTFLLVDYKGGSAFAECVDLPHTVGLVTDLTPHLVRRALTSLRAELRHREALLGAKGAKDLRTLEEAGDPGVPPSLVIVVDEFAALVAEVPEFVEGVVDIAQRGRSLGLHLVLATQRPAGVIRENLRANTNLRIALRMADPADSTDVVGLPLAAELDPETPGRAAARTAPGRVVVFQGAYAGGRSSTRAAGPRVAVETLAFGPGRPWGHVPAPIVPAGEPTDIARVVRAVRAASASARVPPPRRPWLPALPALLDLASLPASTPGSYVLGLADDPARQRQDPARYRPDVDGNLAVFGTSGSGRSTVLRTVAAAAAAAGEPVQLYGLDAGGGALSALKVLPQVGAVVTGDDDERVERLVRTLRTLVADRARRYGESRAATITEYRLTAGAGEEPRVLLLVDGFVGLRAEWEATPGRAPVYGQLLQLLTDGRGVGVHVVLSVDRPAGVPSGILAAVPRRVVLRQADEHAYHLLGVRPDVLDGSAPPGRGIGPDGHETQMAVPGGTLSLTDQALALDRLARDLRAAGVARAPEVGRLPTVLLPERVLMTVDGSPVLGIAGDTLQPVGFDATGTFVVAGPQGSGRTNALRWLLRALSAADPAACVVRLSGRREPDAGPLDAVGPDAVARLAPDLLARLQAGGRERLVVVIEAIAELVSTPAERPLVDLVRALRREGHLLIAEAETAAWASSWPLLTEVRNGRRGLVLQPDAVEGEALFRTPFGRVRRADFPPGRGMYVARGTARTVQLPFLG